MGDRRTIHFGSTISEPRQIVRTVCARSYVGHTAADTTLHRLTRDLL